MGFYLQWQNEFLCHWEIFLSTWYHKFSSVMLFRYQMRILCSYCNKIIPSDHQLHTEPILIQKAFPWAPCQHTRAGVAPGSWEWARVQDRSLFRFFMGCSISEITVTPCHDTVPNSLLGSLLRLPLGHSASGVLLLHRANTSFWDELWPLLMAVSPRGSRLSTSMSNITDSSSSADSWSEQQRRSLWSRSRTQIGSWRCLGAAGPKSSDWWSFQ